MWYLLGCFGKSSLPPLLLAASFYSLIGYSLFWYLMVQYCMVYFGILYGMVWFGKLCCHRSVSYGLFWYLSIWNGMGLYLMVWYGSVSSVVTGPCRHYYRQHLPTAWCGTVWFSSVCISIFWSTGRSIFPLPGPVWEPRVAATTN